MPTLPCTFAFQVSGMGNCLYASVKKGLGVRLTTEKEFPYYPNHYFHHQVANWLVENRQKVTLTQKVYFQQMYGIQDPNATFPGPYSYKEYCHNIPDRRFWGDALILYAISCLWALKITILNSKTLEEYRVQHTAPLMKADIGLVYNASCHYTATGRLSGALVTCYSFIVERPVTCYSCLSHLVTWVACCRKLVACCYYGWSLVITVKADADLVKDVLTCHPLVSLLYKSHHPDDMDEPGNIGGSSEDEAEGMEEVLGITRRLYKPSPAQPSPAQPSPAPEPTFPVPEDEETVRVPKKDLKQAAKLLQDLSAGKKVRMPASASREEVPFEVPDVRAGDTNCYIVGLGPNCKFIDLLFKRSVLIFIKISSFIVSLF